jgi:hypothetical protein
MECRNVCRAAAVLVFALGAASVQAAETLTLPVVAGQPTLDGVREAWWDAATDLTLGQVMQGGAISAEVSVAWNGDSLWLWVEVADPTRWRDSGGNSWDDDAIEVYLDSDGSRGSSYDNVNDVQIRVMASDGAVFRMGGSSALEVDRAWQETATGYSIEMRLAEPTLGGTSPIGFDLQICDDLDGGGRDRKVGWSDSSDRAWTDPSLFGQVTLEGGGDTGEVVFAMNCGGGAFRDSAGAQWSGSGNYAPRNYPAPMSVGWGIAGTEDPTLFQSFVVEESRIMIWKEVPNGLYEVDLGWASLDAAEEFDVTVQSRLVADNFSPRQAAGAARTAVWRTFPALVVNGQLDVTLFRGRVGRPFLNALRVRRVAPDQPVTAPVSLPAVRGTENAVGAEPFLARSFFGAGHSLATWRLVGPPAEGFFELRGRRMLDGDLIEAAALPELSFQAADGFTGRLRFHWQVSDGEKWSEVTPGQIYVRARANSVVLPLEPQWNTFQWPLFAHYPEVDSSKHGAVTGPDGVTRDGNACGPTARSYLMYYWRHPLTPEGDLAYRDTGGTLVALDSSHQYRYPAMGTSVGWTTPAADYAEVAELFADNWTASLDLANSGYNVHATVPAYFDFSGEVRKVGRSEFADDAAWTAALKHELNLGRLVIVDGFSDSGGHWWLVHGYNAAGEVLVKLNYGNSDGYYPATNMAGYYRELTMLSGLYPNHAGEVMLITPRAGVEWGQGEKRRIRWSAPQAERLRLQYSTDGGLSWHSIADSLDAANGTYLWSVPAGISGNVRLRLQDADRPNAYDEIGPIAVASGAPWRLAFDQWVRKKAGIPATERAPADDPDRDGFPLWMEYLAEQGGLASPSDLLQGQWNAAGTELKLSWLLPDGWSADCFTVQAAAEPANGCFHAADDAVLTMSGKTLQIRCVRSDSARFFRILLKD